MSQESTIRRSAVGGTKVSAEERRKKKTRQIVLGVALFIGIIIIAALVQSGNPQGAFVLLIGVGFGYVLQRSRFCFTASLRDPVLTGGTELTKAVIIALTLSTIAFMAINMSKFGMGLESVDLKVAAGHIKPVGLNTVIGAFMFGIGAVIAGGCASGTFMRMGEGFAQQWLAFVFFVIGSVIGMVVVLPMNSVAILKGTPVFLPVALGGWAPAIILQFGALAALYILAMWWQKKKSGN